MALLLELDGLYKDGSIGRSHLSPLNINYEFPVDTVMSAMRKLSSYNPAQKMNSTKDSSSTLDMPSTEKDVSVLEKSETFYSSGINAQNKSLEQDDEIDDTSFEDFIDGQSLPNPFLTSSQLSVSSDTSISTAIKKKKMQQNTIGTVVVPKNSQKNNTVQFESFQDPFSIFGDNSYDLKNYIYHDLDFICESFLTETIENKLHLNIHEDIENIDFQISSRTNNFLERNQKKKFSKKEAIKNNYLSFQEIGEGNEIVIMIHGLAMTSNFWVDGVLKSFPENVLQEYKFICVDMLGYGESKYVKSRHYYSAHEQATRIKTDIIDRFDLQSVHILGHSFGGVVAMHLSSIISKNRIRTIILLSPAFFLSSIDAAKAIDKLVFPANKVVHYPTLSRLTIKLITSLGKYIFPIVTACIPAFEMPARTLRDFLSTDADCASGTVYSIVYEGCDKACFQLQDEGIKVIIIHGSSDVVVPFNCTKSFAERFTNIEHRVFPYGPHHFPLSHCVSVSSLLVYEWRKYNATVRSNIVYVEKENLL